MNEFPCDAVIIPTVLQIDGALTGQLRPLAARAEPLLGIDYPRDPHCFIREIPGGRSLVTRFADDTLMGAKGSPHEGEPRYRWEPREEGIEVGWLILDRDGQAARVAADRRRRADQVDAERREKARLYRWTQLMWTPDRSPEEIREYRELDAEFGH